MKHYAASMSGELFNEIQLMQRRTKPIFINWSAFEEVMHLMLIREMSLVSL